MGIRVPDNPIATALAAELGNPLMTSSLPLINGATPEDYTRPEAIAMILENMVDLMIDGGEGGTGLSTVVDLTDSRSPEIIRQGIGILDI